MRAIVRQGAAVRLQRMPVPVPDAGEVLIQVRVAGLSRTDVDPPADGPEPDPDPVVLGREFTGVIAELAGDVRGFAAGDRVAVMPDLPCLSCERCAGGATECCPRAERLGAGRHGAFSEFVAVPAHVVHRLPEALTFREGAYAEPVCSALAVLKADIKPPDRGLVQGAGRVARLTERVLRSYGFDSVEVGASLAGLPRDAYDFVVECDPGGPALDGMLRVVRPGGRIVLRSRPAGPVPVDLAAAVGKEVTLQTVSYGTFQAALEFLAQESGKIADLLGCVRPLEDFAEMFSAERESQRFKSFFCPDFGGVGAAEIEAWGRLVRPDSGDQR
ncbi:zinc-dependent alcohol dehydrogenase [Streptomyces boncukensis]|nr:alcohol dehydrogenase catalytic domain-containing protein [Streptomyces boncukensis]